MTVRSVVLTALLSATIGCQAAGVAQQAVLLDAQRKKQRSGIKQAFDEQVARYRTMRDDLVSNVETQTIALAGYLEQETRPAVTATAEFERILTLRDEAETAIAEETALNTETEAWVEAQTDYPESRDLTELSTRYQTQFQKLQSALRRYGDTAVMRGQLLQRFGTAG